MERLAVCFRMMVDQHLCPVDAYAKSSMTQLKQLCERINTLDNMIHLDTPTTPAMLNLSECTIMHGFEP